MKVLAFDESGYTGQDLLNREQPVFALSSVFLSDEESRELLSLFSTKSSEIKFNKLRRYARFEKELEKFLDHWLISHETVKISLAHKEYMIIAQTVDKIIEPQANRDGLDLYEEGANLALTNVLYYCIDAFCNPTIFDNYKLAFINLFRNKKAEDIENFYYTTKQLINSSSDEEFKKDLYLVLASYPMINDILSEVDNFTLDVTATFFMVLTAYWSESSKDTFDIIADESKPLTKYSWVFERMKSDKIEKREIGYGSRKITVPLKINRLSFVDSKTRPQIQVADIIAGASAYVGKSLTKYGQKDSLSEMIYKSKLMDLIVNPIWPHKAFTPKQLNMDKSGSNPIDELTRIIFP